MRRTWVKLYVDQCLRGSMIAELSPSQRWIFVGLILLAGDSPIPGIVYRRKDENGAPIGYSHAVLADTLGVAENTVAPALARMVEKSKIAVDAQGVITITNWSKYQSEYQRQKPYRQAKDGACNFSDDVEGEVDIDIDVDVDKKKIRYDARSRSWENITSADMEAWAKAYPACDLASELARMGEWLIANPERAVKSKWRRFITNWLSRSQDRGGATRKTGKYGDDYEAAIDRMKLTRDK